MSSEIVYIFNNDDTNNPLPIAQCLAQLQFIQDGTSKKLLPCRFSYAENLVDLFIEYNDSNKKRSIQYVLVSRNGHVMYVYTNEHACLYIKLVTPKR